MRYFENQMLISDFNTCLTVRYKDILLKNNRNIQMNKEKEKIDFSGYYYRNKL